MIQARLLKRIALWNQNQSLSDDELIDSLLDDIADLLNSKQGNVLIDEAMGMVDIRALFHQQPTPDTEFIEQQLATQIRTYEARIEQFQLNFDQAASQFGRLQWQLNLQLPLAPPYHQATALIIIDMSGHISLERQY